MNRFAGKVIIASYIFFQAGLGASLCQAELTASIDRREISLGETLRLTLFGDAGEQPTDVDLSALYKDWEVLSRSSSTNARYVNGQNKVTRSLEMELSPLREGILSIPAFADSGRQTTPISVRVNPEPLVAPGDAVVLFGADVDKSSVYVQAELILTVTLQQAINLDGGEISAIDVLNAVVEPLERRSFQRRIGNRTWLVTELPFAIYPEKSGLLEIPTIEYSAREVQPGRSLLGNRLGRRIKLASEPLQVEVKSAPASFPGKVWLPASSLALEETWSLDTESLIVGDSTTRTLTLVASGLQGSQLPPLSSLQGALNITGLRFYPDQESIDQEELSSGFRGRRVQSEALVAQSAGSWKLPEIKIPWWNTETDQLEYALLSEKHVAVSTTTEIPSGSMLKNSVTTTTNSNNGLTSPDWIIAFGTVGWILSVLLGFLLWRASKHRVRMDPDPQAINTKKIDQSNVRQQVIRIKRAIKTEDSQGIRNALLDWATLYYKQPVRSLNHLQTLCSIALSEAVDGLDRSLYGEDSSVWKPNHVLEAIRKEPGSGRKLESKKHDLHLYPNS